MCPSTRGGLIVRRFLIAAGAVVALSGIGASGAGAVSTGVHGQPGAFVGTSCGSGNATSEPAGFSSGGFANAENHYANPGTTPSQSGHAVSEYDIACLQQTANGH
jgi:hypothetical protein